MHQHGSYRHPRTTSDEAKMFDFTVHGWNDVASIVTITAVPIGLVGLLLAYRQLKAQATLEMAEGELQAATYEDSFVREYRKIVQQIPTAALLGELLTPRERTKSLNAFYHYIDLCNEQAYQAKLGRIRKATWDEWKSGIEGNLRRPEFMRAWAYVAAKSDGEFQDLRVIVNPAPYDTNSGYPPPPGDQGE